MSISTQRRYFGLGIAILFAVISTPLAAGHKQGSDSERRYDNANYDYAKVVDVKPITELVQIPQEQQICQQETVRRRVPEHRSHAPAVFGAILGGVIGSQFGGGHGKTAATIAGATIGGAVASNEQHRRYPHKYYNVSEQRCHTETSWQNEERVVAWDVSWKYHGKVYHSTMDEPPGDRIQVRVSVDPVY